MTFIILLNTAILLSLSMLHIYWAFGGKWALEGAIPKHFYNSAFNTSYPMKMKLATLVVAIGLFFFASIIASNTAVINIGLPAIWIKRGTLLIGIIFTLRAIGDFKYVGLFKKEKEGVFAIKDSRIYIPLCLLIGVLSFLIY